MTYFSRLKSIGKSLKSVALTVMLLNFYIANVERKVTDTLQRPCGVNQGENVNAMTR